MSGNGAVTRRSDDGKDSASTRGKDTIDHHDALQAYLEMGGSRNLRGLREELQRRFSKTGRKPPSERTIMKWSSLYGWQQQASVYDQRIADGKRRDLITRQVEQKRYRRQQRLDSASDMHEVVYKLFRTEVDGPIDPETGTPTKLLVLRPIHEFRPAIVRMIVMLSQEARDIEREELGLGPEQEETQAGGTGVIQTREELIKVYDDIDRMVKILQSTYQDKSTIEGDFTTSESEETEESEEGANDVPAAWDVGWTEEENE
jgi:hypothetical protein